MSLIHVRQRFNTFQCSRHHEELPSLPSLLFNTFVTTLFSVPPELIFLRPDSGVAGESNSRETIGEGVRRTQSRRFVTERFVVLLARLSSDEEAAFLIGDVGSERLELGMSFLRGGTESFLLTLVIVGLCCSRCVLCVTYSGRSHAASVLSQSDPIVYLNVT